MLFNTDIGPLLVQEDIITLGDYQKISAAATDIKKAEIVLQIVSYSLEIGYTEPFYKIIQILKYYGNGVAKRLCADIENEITGLDGKKGTIEFHCKYTKLSYTP